MCRLLVVKADKEFKIKDKLVNFAIISRESKEFQGHGWGLSYLDEKNNWQHYKNIKPIWEDDLEQFSETKLLVAHARSAFEDKDIVVENNMPFYDDKYIFMFNGELRGVRIKEEGRIGAEKIFNYIKRFDKGDTKEALEKGVNIIKKRTHHIKGMNIIMVTKKEVFLSTYYSEDPDYFRMHYKESPSELLICSDPFVGEHDWTSIPNNSVEVWQ